MRVKDNQTGELKNWLARIDNYFLMGGKLWILFYILPTVQICLRED